MKRFKFIFLFAIGFSGICWASFYPVKDLTDSGNRALLLENYEEAISFFQQAYELDQENILSMFNLANAYHDYGRSTRAEEIFQAGITLALKKKDYYLLPSLYYNLGNTQYKKQQYGKAMENYIKAMDLDPNDRQIKKNFELAFQKLQENNAVNPNSPSQKNQQEQESRNNSGGSQENDLNQEENQNTGGGQDQSKKPANDNSSGLKPLSKKSSDGGSHSQIENSSDGEATDQFISLNRAEQILNSYINRQKKFEAFRKYNQTLSSKLNNKNW